MFTPPSLPVVAQNTAPYSIVKNILVPQLLENAIPAALASIPDVPFYSQFQDITSAKWKKVGCGVTSLAMIIDYYTSGAVSVDKVLAQGISAGAYLSKAGWTYSGLIGIAQKYGLSGSSYDLGKMSSAAAFSQFADDVKDGPVIASVHYEFNPKSSIPHLVVINGIKDGVVYYNDPAAKTADKRIAVADFLKGWKKRYVVVRPA